ncbi:hypothetical protein lerEdw1_000094 [Lerista edwardsae]|nr:hypothetical protein lerEdw1_000094 [Lerista edwardsae]
MELRLSLLLLSAALLVELSIQRHLTAGGPKAGAAARTVQQLCGVDLKRAVISLCGASRWKREEMDPPPSEEPSWSDFIEYHLDENRNIPEVKGDPVWSSEQTQIQRDHAPDTEPDWRDLFALNDDSVEYTAAGADSGGQESPDAKGLANPTASHFPQAKDKRKRDAQSDMEAKCCNEGCTGQEISSVFCSK